MTTYTGCRTKIKHCPNNCTAGKFSTTAHVSQTWVVDMHGNFIEAQTECDEITHGPNFDNIWVCQECGAEAVTIQAIVFSLAKGMMTIIVPTNPDFQNQIIVKTPENGNTTVTPSEIIPNKKAVKFSINGITYLAHINTDTLDEGV